jgi:hypothetical protein
MSKNKGLGEARRLKLTDVYPFFFKKGKRAATLDYVKCLNTNSYLGFADWRLPNRNELSSLVDYAQLNQATWLVGLGFSGVQSVYIGPRPPVQTVLRTHGASIWVTATSTATISPIANMSGRSGPLRTVPLGTKNEGWEKDTDARRWRRRCIDDPRRDIYSFRVAIRPINTPASLIHIVAAVISTASFLVTAVVVFSIFAEGRRHVYTADHYG